MRFLFCSLDTPGLLYPSVGLATVLRARGHQVAFVTDIQQSAFLAEAGFERIPRGLKDGKSFEVATWGQPLSIAIQVKHIEHALEVFPAHGLVSQCLALGPLIVANRRKLPVGVLGFCTYLWPAFNVPSRDWERVNLSTVEDWRGWRHSGMLTTLNRARALFRLPAYATDCRDTPLTGDLFMVRSVPELEPDASSLPQKVHLVGSCLWEPEVRDDELESWLAETADLGVPLIYVQHGRFFHIPSFWPRLVEALGKLDCRVAASTGRLDSSVGELPRSFFVRPYIPQGRVLEVARVAVASANTTVVLGTLTAGIPSLLIPGGGEQPDVASLCKSAGVAKVLTPQEATVEGICEAVAELLKNRTYRDRAAQYQAFFSNIDGPERAADLLEILAERQTPVLRQEREALAWPLSTNLVLPIPA